MLKYIAKRVLIFVPTIIAISLINFVISLNAPGDPVENILSGGNQGNQGQLSDKLAGEQAYGKVRHELGLDLPVFYFSVSSLASCDTLYKIQKIAHRDNLYRLVHAYGNWEDVEAYYEKIKTFELNLFQVEKDSTNAQALIRVRDLVNQLYANYDKNKVKKIFSQLDEIFNSSPTMYNQSLTSIQEKRKTTAAFGNLSSFAHMKQSLNETQSAYNAMVEKATQWKKYIPALHFYGLHNQYHRWITRFVIGDFGISYQDKRPVASVMWDALRWTLMISMIAICITYLVAVPIGVRSAVTRGSWQDQLSTTFLFVLYSLPNFWIATMLVMFLGGGDFLDVFPPYGLGELDPEDPFIDRFFDTAYHLILPLFCLTYPTFAFLSRQTRGGMLTVLNQDFIRTARAKGLPENKIIWKHSFRNALLPVITLFANVFPYAIAGSIVLEIIFSIPGMGKVAYEAIFARNYPVVFTVVMFSSILTLIGYLVADILYAFVDPRISYGRKNK